MKKSIRKTCEYLSRYIGQEIIRTAPAIKEEVQKENHSSRKCTEDIDKILKKDVGMKQPQNFPTKEWEYTHSPIELCGFTPKGEIICHYTGVMAEYLGYEEKILPLSFTDRRWITYKKACKSKHNELNKWRGRQIRRIRPTENGDNNFSGCGVTLLSASKYHIRIIWPNSMESFYDLRYANPADWVLVEEE